LKILKLFTSVYILTPNISQMQNYVSKNGGEIPAPLALEGLFDI
jgi:hypothetical protein